MRKFVSRLVVVIASAIVSMAFVTVAAPGVSSADCDQGQWWDPVGNVCRPLAPLGCQFGQFRFEAAPLIEEFLWPVAPHPGFQQFEVFGMGGRVGKRHLVGTEGALNLQAIDHLWPRPALG